MNLQNTFSTTASTINNRDGARSRSVRNRRVRSCYPPALVELALVLCGTVGTREAASVLGVGMSTVYRWVGLHRTAWVPRNFVSPAGQPPRVADVVGALSTRCERAGFSLRSSSLYRDANASKELLESSAAETLIQKLPSNVETNRIASLTDVSANGIPATKKMIRAKREIDENFATPISCQTLADCVSMRRFAFIKQFAATFGVPPYHYLLGVRVTRAWEMLQRSDLPLSAVAAATGFGSAGSMQRSFKRFAGASPGKVVNLIAPFRDVVSANSHGTQMLCAGQNANAQETSECQFREKHRAIS